MRKIRSLFAVILLTAFSTVAFADAVLFSWDRPTLRNDGSTLPTDEIVDYAIECGLASGGPYDFVSFVATHSQLSDAQEFISGDVFPPDDYFCRIGANTLNPDDGVSILAPAQYKPVSFTVTACTVTLCGAQAPPSATATVL